MQSPADTVNQVSVKPLDSLTIVDIRKAKKTEAENQCDMTKDYLDREFAQYKKRTIDCSWSIDAFAANFMAPNHLTCIYDNAHPHG
jgi:hypothetical protein